MDGILCKIVIAASFICIALASLTYVWDSYRRYRFEQIAEERCAELMELYGERFKAAGKKAEMWLGIRQCIAEATYGQRGGKE
jgi:hypothetical protein